MGPTTPEERREQSQNDLQQNKPQEKNDHLSLTWSVGKLIPTRKLAVQLQQPAKAMAAGRGPWENSSATMNHGIGPGPSSNIATKSMTAKMAT